ncbi:AEC family transporter [Peribacillus loiseleuriae]|uniref:Malonate transporter n=1 Tax=Peribacillus loiseleuriae TaxID=1679170 RepID=A0A0K9GVQ2_9BACI|nr:AEC family transporter [Peribacillus loiseleuriae]KMY50720.1 malonate transporter [Peribacillus loiseleuriae]
MNQQFLYIIVIICIGYLLKRINLLKEKDGETISRIIFNITLPALVIVSLNSVKIEPSLILLPVIAFLIGFISLFLAFFVFKKEERVLKGTLMMMATGYNVGLFAFPLVEAIWGPIGLIYFGMFDIGNSLIVFGLSYIAGSYYSEKGLVLKPIGIVKKLSKSVPLMTYIIAGTLSFSNIHFPGGFIDIATIISKANLPLSLLLLGLYLNFNFEKQYLRPTIKYVLFRYGFGLIVGLAFYFLLPFNQMFRYTILIGLLLPVGLSVLPFAHEFKYSTHRLIGTLSNICIVISIIILYLFANFIL